MSPVAGSSYHVLAPARDADRSRGGIVMTRGHLVWPVWVRIESLSCRGPPVSHGDSLPISRPQLLLLCHGVIPTVLTL